MIGHFLFPVTRDIESYSPSHVIAELHVTRDLNILFHVIRDVMSYFPLFLRKFIIIIIPQTKMPVMILDTPLRYITIEI